MPTFDELSPSQFRQAIKLSEQIESLRQRLYSILGNPKSKPGTAAKTKSESARKPGKRNMSAAGRARIAAAATARWAKFRQKAPAAKAKTATKTAPKKKGGLTLEGRAKLAASMRARWAERKKNAPAAK